MKNVAKKIELQGKKTAIKNVVYILSFLIIYILQTSCQFLRWEEVWPMMILSAVLSVAMFEDVVMASVYGVFGGILCDMALNIAVGYSSFIFVLWGATVSLLTVYRYKINLLSYMIFMGIFVLIEKLGIAIYRYGIINLLSIDLKYIKDFLLMMLWTQIVGIIFYYYFAYVSRTLFGNDNLFGWEKNW